MYSHTHVIALNYAIRLKKKNIKINDEREDTSFYMKRFSMEHRVAHNMCMIVFAQTGKYVADRINTQRFKGRVSIARLVTNYTIGELLFARNCLLEESMAV